MKHKILVLKNKLSIKVKDDCEKAQKFFEEKNIFVEFEYVVIDIPVVLQSYMKAKGFNPITGKPDNLEYWGIDNKTKNNIREHVDKGEFQTVIFIYNRPILDKETNLPTNFTNFNPLFKDTELIQMPVNKYLDNKGLEYVITHELMHAFCLRIKRMGHKILDEMDSTIVGGISIPFYKNENPYAEDGNYARTFKNLKPYLDKLYPEEDKTYKYFSQYEVDKWKLTSELFEKLDKAREIAETSFIITSGLRSKEYNKLVGGVKNSTHLQGLGVDLRADTDQKRYMVLLGLLQAGFKRIGIYKSHIHADISASKQEIAWLSDKD